MSYNPIETKIVEAEGILLYVKKMIEMLEANRPVVKDANIYLKNSRYSNGKLSLDISSAGKVVNITIVGDFAGKIDAYGLYVDTSAKDNWKWRVEMAIKLKELVRNEELALNTLRCFV